jgi:hypothetical protein
MAKLHFQITELPFQMPELGFQTPEFRFQNLLERMATKVFQILLDSRVNLLKQVDNVQCCPSVALYERRVFE